jgi:hypothetical protein
VDVHHLPGCHLGHELASLQDSLNGKERDEPKWRLMMIMMMLMFMMMLQRVRM